MLLRMIKMMDFSHLEMTVGVWITVEATPNKSLLFAIIARRTLYRKMVRKR
jgi:hypothetical protein